MADTLATVSDHETLDLDYIFSLEQMLMSNENPSLDIPVLPSTPMINLQSDYGNNDIMDTDDDPTDYNTFIMDILNNSPTVNNSQAGPSETRDETNGHDRENCNSQNNAGFGNPMPLAIWPAPPVPYTCSCCQVLREIIHSNGVNTTKLEIHGRLGMIFHGILKIQYGTELATQNEQHQMLDFCKESTTSVKQFLVQYCEERKQAGYMLLQDPFSIFYETMCVGLTDDDHLVGPDDVFREAFATASGGDCQINQPETMAQPEHVDCQINQPEMMAQTEPVNQPEVAENEAVRPAKISLSEQRKRTKILTLKDAVQYFNLPMTNAAENMNICITVLKKICRDGNLLRWPYRKVKSIENKISVKTKKLTTSDVRERAQVQADIERLRQQLAALYAKYSN